MPSGMPQVPCYECAFRRWLWAREFHHGLLVSPLPSDVLAFPGRDTTVTCRFAIGAVVLSVLVAGCFLPLASAKDEPKWIEGHNAHFFFLSAGGGQRRADGGVRGGRRR